MSDVIDKTEAPAGLSEFMRANVVPVLLRRPDLCKRYAARIPIESGGAALLDPHVLALTALREYIGIYEQPPTPEALLDLIAKELRGDQMDDFALVRELVTKTPNPRDVPRVEQGLTEWMLAEVSEKIVLDLSKDVVDGTFGKTFGEVREKLESALKEIAQVEGGVEVPDIHDDPVDPETATQPTYSRMLAAPWEVLNEEIGGMRSGEICALTGVTGSGKSLFLQEIAVQLRQRGQNVLLVDFENDIDDIVVSHALALTKMAVRDLGYDGAQALIRKAREDATAAGKPFGVVSVLPTRKEMNATELFEVVLRRERELGVTFDSIICDYWDHIGDDDQMQIYRSPYIVQAKQLRLLGNYLRHYGKVAYVGFQTNREGARKKAAKEQVTSADVQGSFQKIQQVQHHLIIERGEGNTSKLRIDKCRRSGKLNGGDIYIQYEYCAAPTKTMARGFVKENGVKRVDAKGKWLSKKAILLEAVRRRDTSAIKGLRLHIETRAKAVHPNKVAVVVSDLQKWLGDPAVYEEAISNLYDEQRIVGMPKKTVFGPNGDQLHWVIFEKFGGEGQPEEPAFEVVI